MNRLSCFFAVLLLLLCVPVFAEPTDIVPQGSSVQDWMASLAADGVFGSQIHPSEFTTEPLHTREQFAKMLEHSVLDQPQAIASVQKSTDRTALVRELLNYLRPELTLDGYDVKSELGQFRTGVLGASLTLQSEDRISDGTAFGNGSGTGFYGIYRADANGTAGRDLSFTLSLSNWYQDWRRDVYNDLGDNDFDMINEGYFEVEGKHGFDLKVGEMYDRWGPAAMGATMLSDNSPAFPQIEVTSPFSLGKHFGRNWRRTQTVGSFTEAGQRRYFQARSLEYDFSSHWTASYQEAIKSTSASSLLLLPLPYLVGKNINDGVTENQEGTDSNIDLTYSANPNVRMYGQLLIDDLKSPFRGHFLGFSLGNGGVTPQKLAWVVGGTATSNSGTEATLEYSYDNDTTYTFHTTAAPWTHGVFDWIGLPTGPNTREIYGRLAQKIGQTTIAIDGRDHWRRDNSYPAPTSSEYGVYLTQNLNQRTAVEVNAISYRQDPFPLQPGQPGYPVDKAPLAPFAFSDPGFKARVNQVDVSFSVTY